MTKTLHSSIRQTFGWKVRARLAFGTWRRSIVIPFLGPCDHCGERPLDGGRAFRLFHGPAVPFWAY